MRQSLPPLSWREAASRACALLDSTSVRLYGNGKVYVKLEATLWRQDEGAAAAAAAAWGRVSEVAGAHRGADTAGGGG